MNLVAGQQVVGVVCRLGHCAEQKGGGNSDESEDDRHRYRSGSGAEKFVAIRVIDPERLKHAPNTVVQVKSNDEHDKNVPAGNKRIQERTPQVVVNVAMFKFSKLDCSGGEVQNVKHDEAGDQ